jgi:hypothetical protein
MAISLNGHFPVYCLWRNAMLDSAVELTSPTPLMQGSPAITVKSNHRTPFGLKDGKILAPAEVDSGLACGCACVGCGANLIAKKGAKVAWHFAHHEAPASQSCVESAIHAAAKQVVLEANYVRVPEKSVAVSRRLKNGTLHVKGITLSPARTIRFDFSRSEVWEQDVSIRPDVVGYRGERRLLVEMYFTHKVNAAKRQKLVALQLPALEVDLFGLSFDTDFGPIRQRVLEDLVYKEWLYYPGEEVTRTQLQFELDEEADELDRQWEARQASEQKKAAEQRERVLKVRTDIAEANERYRRLPADEKERLIRESLPLEGSWPYFLNKSSPEALAIAEDARLWQAALFARFVRGKAVSRAFLDVETAVEWVTSRFGVVASRDNDAELAVRKYLGYLRACGFLEKDDDSYRNVTYQVIFDGLTPPPKIEKRPSWL